MSLATFRERVAAKIADEIEGQLTQLQQIHINPIATEHGIVQPPSSEQIALQTVTLTNRLWAFKKAAAIMDEVFKEMASPRKPQEGEDGYEDPDAAGGEPIYG